MKLNKSERELSNRIAVLLGLISVLIFWVGLFTGYHLYLWAVEVPWHLIPVTLGVFFRLSHLLPAQLQGADEENQGNPGSLQEEMTFEEEIIERIAELLWETSKYVSAAEIKKMLQDKFDLEVSSNKVASILEMLYFEGLLVVRKRSRRGKGLTRFYSFFSRETTEGTK